MFFCVVIGAFALGNAMPSVQNFSQARGAAYALWKIIDTVTCFSSFLRKIDIINLGDDSNVNSVEIGRAHL